MVKKKQKTNVKEFHETTAWEMLFALAYFKK